MSVNISAKNLDSIVKIIESNNELIEYEYKGKENQILVPKVIVDKTYKLMSDLGILESDFKESVKQSIKKGFELSSNDIVISKNGEFFIKLFEKTKKHHVDEKDKDTIVNRYNGIEEDELEQFYHEFFEDSENKNFFVSVATEFVEIYLKDKKITNESYEKNVFTHIHTITFELLIELYDDSDGFFKGFAGYIFRLHFKDVFEHIADILLDEISISNTNIINFLKYYSQDVIVVGGKKYRVPSLEAKDGLKWNVGSMLSIAKMYTKSKRSIQDLQRESVNLNNQIKSLHIGNLTPIEYQTAQIQKRQSYDDDIAHQNRKLEKYLDTLGTIEDPNEKYEMKTEVHFIKEGIIRLKEEKSALSEVAIDQNSIRKYSQLQKDTDSLNRQLKREKLVITQNKESYTSIRESLIKALISKKQLL